jgi:Autotransporter beta-domain
MLGRVCGRAVHIASGIEKPASTKTKRTKWLGIAGVTLLAALSASSGAMAQCVDSGFGFDAEGSVDKNPLLPSIAYGSILNTINTAFTGPGTSQAFVSAPGSPKSDQPTGGVWARGIAGYVDTKADTTTTIKVVPDINVDPEKGTLPANAKQKCQRTDHHAYAGFQVGVDLGSLNIAGTGANLHFGVTGGKLTSWAKNGAPGGGDYKDAEDLKSGVEVPFVGLYAVLTNGGFFADALARWDFFRSTSSYPDTEGFSPVNFSNLKNDARGFSVLANTGYRFILGSGWFIEPSIGAAWSRVAVDPINLQFVRCLSDGDNPCAGTKTFGIAMQTHDIESILGRASLRIGATIPSGAFTWQPFLTASVFNEFAGKTKVSGRFSGDVPFDAFNSTVDDPHDINLDGATFTSSTERVATYAQIGLGTAVASNTGWINYVRADLKIGENTIGFGFNTGLRYQW